MKTKLIILMLLMSGMLQAQSSILFYGMVDLLTSHSVKEVKVEEAHKNRSDYVFLDSRSKEEYEVSHIKNAIWIGYEDFDLKTVSAVDKDASVIVYCSVGYRSGKITEKLQKAGYKDVRNLYGGIFDWVNHKFPVYNKADKTEKIHGYSKTWGVWIKEGEVVY